jgi:hypothetical protein
MIQRGHELPTCQITGPTDDDKDVRLNLMFRHSGLLIINGQTVSQQDAAVFSCRADVLAIEVPLC